MKKEKILLVVMVVFVVIAIWYLEAKKVHPVVAGPGAQSIALTATTSPVNPIVTTSTQNVKPALTLAELAAEDRQAGYPSAIEIVDPTGFVNTSSSFTLGSLIGKQVVLLDFWTYSCINCIRTIPYLNAWYSRYHDQGLQIVGIHTPEFDFEKDIANVSAAVQKYGIQYPVVLDSDYGTWNAYNNLYWPHEYLIDMAGYIVHDQIGEGNYAETEGEIQKLLAERDEILGAAPASMPTSTVFVPSSVISGGLFMSPETYFGFARNSYLTNGVSGDAGAGIQNLVAPKSVNVNSLYLVGKWNFTDQFATNEATGTEILYRYQAGKVYIVASAPQGVTLEVLQDGKPVTTAAGSDVVNGKVFIQASRLYNLINNPDGSGTHTLELIMDSPGLQAFTFTFG
jgi:thiol-disulfide isomerase/thioredoxin